jgi:hypothetical protein
MAGLNKQISEEIGTNLIKIIKGQLLKTEPLNLHGAISSVITGSHGNLPLRL